MLRQLFTNRHQILEGIQNSIFKKENVEQIASQRLQICVSCTEYDEAGVHCLVPGTQPCCGSCGCSLGFKTRSLSSACPLNHWSALLTDAEEEELIKSSE